MIRFKNLTIYSGVLIIISLLLSMTIDISLAVLNDEKEAIKYENIYNRSSINITSRSGINRKDKEKIETNQEDCINPEKKEETKKQDVEVKEVVENKQANNYQQVQTVSKETTQFVGKVTHYGPDCAGCSGTTSSGYNVNNTITYNDNEFGNVRIIAAPKEIPLYSILKLHNYKGGEMNVIVLDRGGAIKGTKFDILVSSEQEAYKWGIQNNVEFEILRWGK